MIWLPMVGLVIGFVVIYKADIFMPTSWAAYISLAALAGLDSVFGGIRAGIEGKFHDDVFYSGFLVNTFLAALLAYLGDLIGVDLLLAAVVALGGRIFLNLSLIRRYLLTQTALSRKRES